MFIMISHTQKKNTMKLPIGNDSGFWLGAEFFRMYLPDTLGFLCG